MLGFVVGLVAEQTIAKRLSGIVAVGNGTAAGAQRAVEDVVRQGATALVSFGVAGGLAPDARAGKILVPRSVLTASGMRDCDETLVQRLGGPLDGLLLGSNAVVASRAEKARLFAQTGATAVDIESEAVATYAFAHHRPFAVLRVVCDPASRALPRAAQVALDSCGKISISRIVAALVKRPDDILPLIWVARDASVARRSLARYVRGLKSGSQTFSR